MYFRFLLHANRINIHMRKSSVLVYGIILNFISLIMNKHLYFLMGCLILCTRTVQGQQLSAEQADFLKKNVSPVCVNESMTNTDWKALARQLENKNIVLIGELNHGSKEIFLIRNELIKYLHNELGFNTILFESGIGELALPDLKKKAMSAEQMTNGFFGGWRTKEFRDLMGFIKEKNISIAGFDVQRTGGSFKTLLAEMATKAYVDTAFYNDLEDRYGVIYRELSNNKTVFDTVRQKTEKLINDYKAVHIKLSHAIIPPSSKEVLLTLQAIVNRIDYLQYMLQFVKDRDWNKRWAARDSLMARNIKWFADNIYSSEKLIVIAHNFHIAKSNENEKVMGEFLSRSYANTMYSIGVFAGEGVYADNSGREVKMKPADPATLDIKHIIASITGFAGYLDMPTKKLNGSEWLYNSIIVNDTFIDLKNSNRMILAKQFDGLLFIKKISMPDK